MINLLKKLCFEQKYICIYTNYSDVSKFIYGKLLFVNDYHVVIYSISPFGKYDGIILKDVNDIFRIEIDGQYATMMNYLINDSELPLCNIQIFNDDAVSSLIKFAAKELKIIAIELNKSGYNDIIGFVQNYNEYICEVKQVDSYGCIDGYSIIKIEDISQISYDSIDEQHLFNLYLCRQSNS